MPELADFIATVTGSALLEIIHGLLGREVRQLCFELPYAAPDWASQREAYRPTAERFAAPAQAVRVSQALLERRLPSGDAHAHAAAVRQCRIDLSRVSLRINELLAAYLAEQAKCFASLDQAAADFRLSPRSLRRALQQDGESYQKVLDRVGMQVAAPLLWVSVLNVEAVSPAHGLTGSFKLHLRISPLARADAPAVLRRRNGLEDPLAQLRLVEPIGDYRLRGCIV